MQSHLLCKCTGREKIKTNGETVQKDGGEATKWQRRRLPRNSDEEVMVQIGSFSGFPVRIVT